jgi:hypothetical protein
MARWDEIKPLVIVIGLAFLWFGVCIGLVCLAEAIEQIRHALAAE